MYRKIISVDNLTKELTTVKYFVEDGTYILEWEHDKFFNDIYELHGYKVFILQSYNYFNNKLGLFNVSDGKTYVVLIRITDATKIEDNYEIIHNYAGDYVYTYKMGLLQKVECISKRSGFIKYSEYLEDYSYNLIETIWIEGSKEKILLIHDDHKLRFKVKSGKIILYNDNGNSAILTGIDDIKLIFKSYPKFNVLRNYIISLIFS